MLHYGENDVLLYIFVCADKSVVLLFLGIDLEGEMDSMCVLSEAMCSFPFEMSLKNIL